MPPGVLRPSLDDVERLSRGLRARRRGLGSRAVPHRLNEDERRRFELAKRKGFAVLPGTGSRRERKGSPLLNTLRQHADALARPLVWVELNVARAKLEGAETSVKMLTEFKQWAEQHQACASGCNVTKRASQCSKIWHVVARQNQRAAVF